MHLLFIRPQPSHIYSFLTIPLLLVGAANSSQAASYTINPASTHIRFAIERFKSSATTGGFYNIEGQLQHDPNRRTGDNHTDKLIKYGQPFF